MPSEIHIQFTTMEAKKAEIEAWLGKNAGIGSARYGGREGGIKHWLNGEWRLDFNSPIFPWIHKIENLGWVWPID